MTPDSMRVRPFCLSLILLLVTPFLWSAGVQETLSEDSGVTIHTAVVPGSALGQVPDESRQAAALSSHPAAPAVSSISHLFNIRPLSSTALTSMHLPRPAAATPHLASDRFLGRDRNLYGAAQITDHIPLPSIDVAAGYPRETVWPRLSLNVSAAVDLPSPDVLDQIPQPSWRLNAGGTMQQGPFDLPRVAPALGKILNEVSRQTLAMLPTQLHSAFVPIESDVSAEAVSPTDRAGNMNGSNLPGPVLRLQHFSIPEAGPSNTTAIPSLTTVSDKPQTMAVATLVAPSSPEEAARSLSRGLPTRVEDHSPAPEGLFADTRPTIAPRWLTQPTALRPHTPTFDEKLLAEKIVSGMALEQKIGQLFMLSVKQNSHGDRVLAVDAGVRDYIQTLNPGGIILFQENIDTIAQLRRLVEQLQQASATPLFVAIDEEGGYVSRLNSSVRMHATKLPSQKTVGRTSDPDMAYKIGEVVGRELSALGINMNFAPVADLDTNPDNPVIARNERSYGSDPELVGKMVAAAVQGIQDQNVSAVLKHFPGHGDTIADSHIDTVIVDHTLERLQSVELVPFRDGVAAGADGVMTVHLQMPHITGTRFPITFSSFFLQDVLRRDIGHDKLIITDSLEMGAITRYWDSPEAAVMAFQAGVDILLDPPAPEAAFETLLALVRYGVISEQRLDESVCRIIRVKLKRGIIVPPESRMDPELVLGNEDHQAIVDEILEKAETQDSSREP